MPVTNPLAKTEHFIETREAVRFGCPRRNWLQVIVRPSFTAYEVRVRNISAKGAALVCDRPIEPGARVAILWDYGPIRARRIVRARVIRVSPCREGDWLVGCVFDKWLQSADVEAFLRNDRASFGLDH
jgi:hypothetical protein